MVIVVALTALGVASVCFADVHKWKSFSFTPLDDYNHIRYKKLLTFLSHSINLTLSNIGG